MIVYKKSFLRVGEIWFDEKTNTSLVDVLCYRYSVKPISDTLSREFYTIYIDLTQGPEQLFAKMKKDTRYEIRRAMAKDGLRYDYWHSNSQELLDEFFDFYNKFAQQKGLGEADYSRVNLLASNNMLDISRVCDQNGEPLVWHAFVRGKNRVQLLSSPSLFRGSTSSAYRNLVGRSNRYHHWQDMLRFKSAGLAGYGLGIWYEGKKDQTKISINNFKAEFGGQISKRFECKKGITAIGKAALQAERLLKYGLSGKAARVSRSLIATGGAAMIDALKLS